MKKEIMSALPAQFQRSSRAISLMSESTVFMESFSLCCEQAKLSLQSGGCLFFCGNGGSAAEAQHFSAELTSKFMRERRAIKSIALTTDTSAITSIGNDFGYEQIFSRQIEALAKPGDLLIAISTSGKSPNIIKAIKAASQVSIHSFLWTGDHDNGKIEDSLLEVVRFPAKSTDLIQEQQLVAGHILCGFLEDTC